jgi:hypothetical protein
VRLLEAMGLCLAVAQPVVAQESGRAPDFTEVRRIIRDGLLSEKATAAAVAVVRDGAIIWEEAFGWADSANAFAEAGSYVSPTIRTTIGLRVLSSSATCC